MTRWLLRDQISRGRKDICVVKHGKVVPIPAWWRGRRLIFTANKSSLPVTAAASASLIYRTRQGCFWWPSSSQVFFIRVFWKFIIKIFNFINFFLNAIIFHRYCPEAKLRGIMQRWKQYLSQRATWKEYAPEATHKSVWGEQLRFRDVKMATKVPGPGRWRWPWF